MSRLARVLQVIGAIGGVCTIAYGVYAIAAYLNYGHARPHAETDPLLDRFMPVYDVREEHHIAVNAPASVTMDAARKVSLNDSPVIRAIFRAREVLLRAKPGAGEQPRAFVDLVQSIGWRALADEPGREIVFGAVTQPWKPDVVFESVAPERFVAFDKPDYVKIVWTLRADPTNARSSIFRTETRAVATDAQAREKFRRYWASYSAGIVLIRRGALSLVKSQAERR